MSGKLLVVLMALMAPCMAISDSDFVTFANGALASDDATASLKGDTLEVVGHLNPYSDMDLSSLGYGLWELTIDLEEVVAKYPGKIKYVQLVLRAPDDSGDVARSLLVVN
jgi:hypothetical protein